MAGCSKLGHTTLLYICMFPALSKPQFSSVKSNFKHLGEDVKNELPDRRDRWRSAKFVILAILSHRNSLELVVKNVKMVIYIDKNYF